MGRWFRYAVTGITGFLVWEVLALVLGNQPNTSFIREVVSTRRKGT